jgi:hypothetical protein
VFDVHKTIDPAVAGMAIANLNMKTSPPNAPGVPKALACFASDAAALAQTPPIQVDAALLVRLHFVAREHLGARILPGPPWRLEVGFTGACGAWRVVAIDAPAATAHPSVPLPPIAVPGAIAPRSAMVGPGGLGVVRSEVPLLRDLLGATWTFRLSQAPRLPGWSAVRRLPLP